MTLKFFILFVPAFIFAGSFEVSAQNRQMKLSDKERRDIFRRILQDTDFSEAVEYSSNETVYLSTINIPLQLQSDFPEIKGVKFRFITPREIENLKLPLRIFYFGEFKTKSSTPSSLFR